MMNKTLLISSLILFLATSASADELECSAVQGTGKMAFGAAVGGTAAVTVTWVGAIIAAPFTGGSSFVAAFYGTPAAAAFGAKGGAILGVYHEAGDCLLGLGDED